MRRRCALLPLLRSVGVGSSVFQPPPCSPLRAAAACAAAQRRAASSDFASAAAGGGGWSASALERASLHLSAPDNSLFGEDEGEDDSFGDADEEDEVDVPASQLFWPPPSSALAASPQLAHLVAQAAAREAGEAEEARVREVAAFAIRLVELVADKLPMTARPSLTLSLLSTYMTLADVRRECLALGVPGHEPFFKQKKILCQLLYDYAAATPAAFAPADPGRAADRRVRGLVLPWDLVLQRRLAAQNTARRASEDKGGQVDPLRERKQYARVVTAHEVAALLAAAHAEAVTVIHVGSACTWADAFVIASARSGPHLQALAGAALHFFSRARAAAAAAGEAGLGPPPSVEGRAAAESPEWLVVDMDSVVVHLFLPQMRAEYALEQLWGEEHGCKVEYITAAPAAPAAAAAAEAAEAADDGASADAAPQPAPTGDWAPLIFDRRAGSVRAYRLQPDPEELAAIMGEGDMSRPLPDEDEDEEEEEEEAALEAQAAVFERYEAASAKHAERLAKREAVLYERAQAAAARRDARRKAAAEAAAAAQAQAHAHFVLLAADAAAGTLPAPPPPAKELMPPARTQLQLLEAAFARGLDYGAGAGRGRHERDCECAACAAGRGAISTIVAKAARVEDKGVHWGGAAQLCSDEACACTRCVWLRWRVVALVQRDVAGAARLGVAHIRRGRKLTLPKKPA